MNITQGINPLANDPNLIDVNSPEFGMGGDLARLKQTEMPRGLQFGRSDQEGRERNPNAPILFQEKRPNPPAGQDSGCLGERWMAAYQKDVDARIKANCVKGEEWLKSSGRCANGATGVGNMAAAAPVATPVPVVNTGQQVVLDQQQGMPGQQSGMPDQQLAAELQGIAQQGVPNQLVSDLPGMTQQGDTLASMSRGDGRTRVAMQPTPNQPIRQQQRQQQPRSHKQGQQQHSGWCRPNMLASTGGGGGPSPLPPGWDENQPCLNQRRLEQQATADLANRNAEMKTGLPFDYIWDRETDTVRVTGRQKPCPQPRERPADDCVDCTKYAKDEHPNECKHRHDHHKNNPAK